MGDLWVELFKRAIKIDFAHRTFAWKSEARGAAHVHVVIIGFSDRANVVTRKAIFDHSDPTHIRKIAVKNINPYLVEGSDIFVRGRSGPLSDETLSMSYGSMMIDKSRKAGDDEGLVFDADVRRKIIKECPASNKWIKPILGADEFINGPPRYCLWIPEDPTAWLSKCKSISDRVKKVRTFGKVAVDRKHRRCRRYLIGLVRSGSRNILICSYLKCLRSAEHIYPLDF